MKNINIVTVKYQAGDKITRVELALAIKEMLSVQHSLSIVDIMHKLFKTFDENQRRRIQHVLSDSPMFTKSMEVRDRNLKLAKHIYVLTEDAKKFNIPAYEGTLRKTPAPALVGISKIIDDATELFANVSKDAEIIEFMQSDYLTQVRKIRSFIDQDNSTQIVIKKYCDDNGVGVTEFDTRMRQNVHARLRKLIQTSPEWARVQFVYA